MPEFNSKEEYEKWKAEKTKGSSEKFSKLAEEAQQALKTFEPTSNKTHSSFDCPKCKSENIQKASLLIELQTKDFKSTSSTIGVGAGNIGGVATGVGVSETSTTGTITARIANQLKCPIKPPKDNTLLGILQIIWVTSVGGVFVGFLNITSIQATFLIITFVPIAVGIPIYYYRHYLPNSSSYEGEYKRECEKYERELAKWEKTFCCLRCGEIFQIG